MFPVHLPVTSFEHQILLIFASLSCYDFSALADNIMYSTPLHWYILMAFLLV